MELKLNLSWTLTIELKLNLSWMLTNEFKNSLQYSKAKCRMKKWIIELKKNEL